MPFPKWILFARAEQGDWHALATVANIREVQLVLSTMLSVHEARLCRIEEQRAIPIEVTHAAQ